MATECFGHFFLLYYADVDVSSTDLTCNFTYEEGKVGRDVGRCMTYFEDLKYRDILRLGINELFHSHLSTYRIIYLSY